MAGRDLKSVRKQYRKGLLDPDALPRNPMVLLSGWLDEALSGKEPEPNAMTLATASGNMPSARIVLLKELNATGLVFFTNYLSRKGRELESNPRAAAVLFWASLERQVRVEGIVEKTPEDYSTAYFESRPLNSRISAAVSPQSEAVPMDRKWLQDRFEEYQLGLQLGNPRRPEHWGGYHLIADCVEFWSGRPDRLHDRFEYRLNKEGEWIVSRLAP